MADTERPPEAPDQPVSDTPVQEKEEEETEIAETAARNEESASEAPSEAIDEKAPVPPQDPEDMPTPVVASPPTLEIPQEETPNRSETPRTTEFFEHHLRTDGRPRTDSQSTAATMATTATRPSTRNSLVFVVNALEAISASKDARKNKKLGDSTANALNAIKQEGDPSRINPEILFEPLQLASEAPTVSVSITALDCIGKLISYSYFSVPSEPQPDNSEVPPLIERAIDTICDCFQGEATPPEIQLQIVKSLLAAILNDKIVVHGNGLMKAVRLTYNIFLLSKSTANQQVAQGALTQMIGTVFERVKTRLVAKEARLNLSRLSLNERGESDENIMEDNEVTSPGGDVGEPNGEEQEGEERSDNDLPEPNDKPVDKHTGPKITLQSFENNVSFNDDRINDNAPTLVTQIRKKSSRHVSGQETSPLHAGSDSTEEDDEDEIFVKDAYLVLRAMCRLSTKSLPVDQALDVRSHGMRSKLLSLHIIHTTLHNNIAVFVSPYATIRGSSGDEPTTFIQAIKHNICLSLSRNGASSVRQVFEVSCEIFWQMLKNLRVMLKKEVEVFLKEIYLAVLDKRNAPVFQKQYILTVFGRLAADPRALVEVYLNYDCDRTALDNMYQRVVEQLSKLSSTPVSVTPVQQQAYQDYRAKHTHVDWQSRATMPPSLSTASMNHPHENDTSFPQEYAMKQESLSALVEILRSLVNWSQQSMVEQTRDSRLDSRTSFDDLRPSFDARGVAESPNIGGDSGTVTPLAEDDPSQLEKAKQRKTALTNAMRQFNYKPKRGLKVLLKDGFIPSDSPQDIARFLLDNEAIDKKALGEFLGEGDQENIAIMHAFVDLMEFSKTRFVDALRRFLQSFRLPGEAQKIDRFMLKFAERYITGNPNAFANADTAYVLAYSVIMLNTDQHSKKLKGARMTPEDFIKNNRGINDNADLPDDYLRGIFEEISHNEIVLETEQEAAANMGLTSQSSGGLAANIGQALTGGGRDLKREAYVQASEEMANKTTELYKQLLRAQRRTATKMPVSKYIPASSSKHIGPMFEVTWMPFLTALSGQAQDHNIEIVRLCIEGIKLAIRVSCLFDLENPRQAFVSFLARFTNLYNLSEMKAKNVEALKVLIEVANTEGNLLRESWRDILTCISQLDRFQLISTGVDERAVPDVLKAQMQPQRPSSSRSSLNVPNGRRRQQSQAGMHFQADVAEESRSTDIIRGVDRIFTNTANLSGEAIVDFVKALTQVSWQEIQSSGQSESPRTYSLQKLVEISGYNMNRVRFEWTNLWQILGAHFNDVGCHTNTNVVYFALNSLRQLSMKFMEIEELPGFKFQKDFLKPFEHIMNNSSVVSVKDMVLRCLIQMIQARGENIRSGWKTMFGVFTVAAREPYEGIVNLAFENVTQVYNTRFGVVISQGAFADLIVCLTEFSKNVKFQKKSLQAIELLKSTVPKMLRTPECPLSVRAGFVKETDKGSSIPKQPTRQTQEEQFWFPVLFAFHDVLMTGEDLEVRSRALNYLFDTLITYGADFPREFWNILWRQLLYPIFMVLKSKSEMTNVLKDEDQSVWLSTTMIQALRNMIKLFTHFFDSLEYMLDRFLDLLALCICQENDTLARIGSNCLQQLILQNVQKFQPRHWSQIVKAFVELFQRTEATALFSAATSGSSYTPTNGNSSTPAAKTPTAETPGHPPPELSLQTPTEESSMDNALGINGLNSPRRASVVTSEASSTVDQRMPSPLPKRQTQELEDYRPESQDLQQPPVVVTAARRRFFNQIITKCVLQLLMIETVQELFTNDAVYEKIPSGELLRLMGVLKKSYHFAKRFNADRDLRSRLFREGFMKQPPNLLKQESGSASVYVSILFRMYHDKSTDRAASRTETEEALIPLCEDIIASYIELDEETQQRNIVTWRPVVVTVLDGYINFPKGEFEKHIDIFAPLGVGLLGTEMAPDIQRVVQHLVMRIFETKLGIEKVPLMMAVPPSPRGSFSQQSPAIPRRFSRGR